MSRRRRRNERKGLCHCHPDDGGADCRSSNRRCVVVLIRGNTGNPLNHAKVATADYIDASGNTGQRATISVNKNALTKVTEKQFASFYEKTVSGSEYALFTIACDDGTGIVFLSSPQSNADGTTTIAAYGYLNENGEVTESFGQILLDGGKYKYQAQ